MRMNTDVFDNLLRGIADKIQRSNTIMRDAIPARDKLQITLSFLAIVYLIHKCYQPQHRTS